MIHQNYIANCLKVFNTLIGIWNMMCRFWALIFTSRCENLLHGSLLLLKLHYSFAMRRWSDERVWGFRECFMRGGEVYKQSLASPAVEPSRPDTYAQHISSAFIETKQVGPPEKGWHDVSKYRLTALRRISPSWTQVKTWTVACLHALLLMFRHSRSAVFVLLRVHELNLDQVRRK